MHQDSQIISVSLVRYADACPPGELHSDCPFAHTDGENGRICAQECRDVIVRLARPGHTKAALSAGGGLFDARQLLLSETGRVPDEGWHTASLLQRLRAALSVPPKHSDGAYHIKREIDVTNALAFLAQRGHDPVWLVREGVGTLLPIRLLLWICALYSTRLAGSTEDPSGGWLEIFEGHVGPIDPTFETGQLLALAQRMGFYEHLQQWARTAPLEDVLYWRPVALPDGEVATGDGLALWIVERFTQTFLTDWNVPSLHHEFRYLNGEAAPVPSSEMVKRVVPANELTREIARRAVKPSDQDLGMVTRQALLLLGDGRRREAASLFDAARILDPTNPDAHNHYGFCLSLDDPRMALAALMEAERIEVETYPLNRVNQAVVHLLLDDVEAALAAAERAWGQRRWLPEVGWLWHGVLDEGEREVGEVNPHTYLCSLGMLLADKSADEEAGARWTERLDRTL